MPQNAWHSFGVAVNCEEGFAALVFEDDKDVGFWVR
jgi:hypothetical protein